MPAHIKTPEAERDVTGRATFEIDARPTASAGPNPTSTTRRYRSPVTATGPSRDHAAPCEGGDHAVVDDPGRVDLDVLVGAQLLVQAGGLLSVSMSVPVRGPPSRVTYHRRGRQDGSSFVADTRSQVCSIHDVMAQRLKTRRPGISSGMRSTWADNGAESVQPAAPAKGVGRQVYGVTLLALATGWLAWSRRRHGRPRTIPGEDPLSDRDSAEAVPRSRVRAAVEASKAAVSAATVAARR